ncbi:hypothetical protein B5F40_00415 [Gordonibacter sp. An230]|uniref:leucine-rich repeat domain-containing protein n=1 Tax=Gordonibacter sp. An230 TaxID=1965592 RepID=UPI000B37B5D3|nr:hypothetical protein [Gordonibacter sp. An230]OUO92404.1 hypothetical protein B5F40_00415 [Gordonibacter sp. An230]
MPDGVAEAGKAGEVSLAEAFPNEAFREYVADRFDQDGNGSLSEEEITQAISIYITDAEMAGAITDLTGIETLTNLSDVTIYGLGAANVDLTGNENVTFLDISNSPAVTTLDISNCYLLTNLSIQNTGISELELLDSVRYQLFIGGSRINGLDVPSRAVQITLDAEGGTPLAWLSSANKYMTVQAEESVGGSASEIEEYSSTVPVKAAEDGTVNLEESFPGLDPSKVDGVVGADYDKATGVLSNVTDTVTYTYETGINDFTLNVTLNVDTSDVPVPPGINIAEAFANDDSLREYFEKVKDENGDGYLSEEEVASIYEDGVWLDAIDGGVGGWFPGGVESLDDLVTNLPGLTILHAGKNAIPGADLTGLEQLSNLDMTDGEGGSTSLGWLNVDGLENLTADKCILPTTTKALELANDDPRTTNLKTLFPGIDLSKVENPRGAGVYDAKTGELSDLLGGGTFTYTYNAGTIADGQKVTFDVNIEVAVEDTDVSVDPMSFPDDAWRSYVETNLDKDGVQNSLTEYERSLVTELSGLPEGIEDLTGIEHFANLETLDCSGLSLGALDLSGNSKLTTLDCSDNQLTSLSLEQNAALSAIKVAGNPLMWVKLSPEATITGSDLAQGGAGYGLTVDGAPFDMTLFLPGIEIDRVSDVVGATLTGTELSDYSQGTPVAYSYDTGAKDGSGQPVLFAGELDLTVGEPQFPDPVFQAYVNRNFEKNGQIGLQQDELKAVNSINVSGLGIKSLEGIELFTELTSLDCSNNQLTELDVAHNTKLASLNCSHNQLSAFNLANTGGSAVSTNMLTQLDLSYNELRTVDLTQLCNASAGDETVTATVNLEGNDALVGVDFPPSSKIHVDATLPQDNVIDIPLPAGATSFNVTDEPLGVAPSNVSLRGVEGHVGYDMATGEASGVVHGEAIIMTYRTHGYDADGAAIDYEVTLNPVVDGGEVDPGIEISEANFPDAALRDFLGGYDENGNGFLNEDEQQALTSLNVSGNADIKSLAGIEKLTTVKYLDISNTTGIEALDVSAMPSLQMLTAQTSALKTLELGEAPELATVNLLDSQVESLDIAGCKKLGSLSAAGNPLTSIAIGSQPALGTLELGGTGIAELDVTGCPKLQNLNFDQTDVTSIDLSQCPELMHLYCGNAAIESLDVTANTKLEILWAPASQLSGLKIAPENDPAFKTIYVSGTPMTDLDVSMLPHLEELQMEGLGKGVAGYDMVGYDTTANTNLSLLEIANNNLAWMHMADNETTRTTMSPGYFDLGLLDDTFDIEERFPGLDASRIRSVEGAVLDGSTMSGYREGAPIVYTYYCGRSGGDADSGAPAPGDQILTVTLDFRTIGVRIVEDLSRPCDGAPVHDPATEVQGGAGEPELAWYERDGAAEGGWRLLDGPPSMAGDYKVVATVRGAADDGTPVVKSDERLFTISRSPSSIVIEGDLSKVEDGEPVGLPPYSQTGTKVPPTWTWWALGPDGSWRRLDAAPSEPGDYRLVGEVAGNRCYEGARVEQGFSIRAEAEPAPPAPEGPAAPLPAAGDAAGPLAAALGALCAALAALAAARRALGRP